MAERLIKLYLPQNRGTLPKIRDVIDEDHIVGLWTRPLEDDFLETVILVDIAESETVLDKLEQHYSSVEGYRLVLLSVEASLPRPEPKEEPKISADQQDHDEDEKPKRQRISREELYADMSETSQLTWTYVVMVVLSTVVAATGMIRDNVAVIIGAMVIAPLLGPNVTLSLATTLADTQLARRALLTNLVGIGTALVCAVAIGMFFDAPLDTQEITSRTQVELTDIALALASGVAGALAFTTGASSGIIGVMVAVALLPPLTGFGMLLGAGLWTPALGALLLLLCNIICVNLAGVCTFLAQGLRPSTWFEVEQARRATAVAVAIWIALLLSLVAILYFADPDNVRLDLTEQTSPL